MNAFNGVADEMMKFKAAHPELRVEMPERMAYDGFAQLLRRTKLFVSPWGCVRGFQVLGSSACHHDNHSCRDRT